MSLSYHFLNRLGFGPRLEWLKDEASWMVSADIVVCQKWLWDNLPNYQPLSLEYRPRVMVPEDEHDRDRLAAAEPMMPLVMQWLDQMVHEENPLREKVALFWHHHLPSTGGREVGHARQLLEIFREKGMGDFRSLLQAVIRTPAFQRFLDLRASEKERPNENFAREFLELHTMGEGHYHLKDVKEAARAFTGFNYRSQAPYPFILDHLSHDSGMKEFLGAKGNLDGDAIIDIILEQPATARHVASSFLRFFFSDQPSAAIIDYCASSYRESGYEMHALINALMEHPNFSEASHHRNRVKTPVELMVGIQRQTGLRLVGQKTVRYFLMRCGHWPFYPPSVAGWKGGPHWLRGEKLLYRIFLPVAFMDIANRNAPRGNLQYKIMSRIVAPSKRELRYFADAVWNEEVFEATLQSAAITPSQWLLGVDAAETDIRNLIMDPQYQYC